MSTCGRWGDPRASGRKGDEGGLGGITGRFHDVVGGTGVGSPERLENASFEVTLFDAAALVVEATSRRRPKA